MSWQHWVLIIWLTLEALLAIGKIGKEREPFSARNYAETLFTLVAWGLLAVTG